MFAKFWKVAGLINFLVFLSRGQYQFLIERILGIRSVFPAAQGVRQVSHHSYVAQTDLKTGTNFGVGHKSYKTLLVCLYQAKSLHIYGLELCL